MAAFSPLCDGDGGDFSEYCEVAIPELEVHQMRLDKLAMVKDGDRMKYIASRKGHEQYWCDNLSAGQLRSDPDG